MDDINLEGGEESDVAPGKCLFVFLTSRPVYSHFNCRFKLGAGRAVCAAGAGGAPGALPPLAVHAGKIPAGKAPKRALTRPVLRTGRVKKELPSLGLG